MHGTGLPKNKPGTAGKRALDYPHKRPPYTCAVQMFDPWLNLADATDTGAFATFLQYFSWVLLLPAPCLLQVRNV